MENRMNMDKMVCNCMSVTNGMIKACVDGGASTLEDVQEATKAGTACGFCKDDVSRLVEQFVAERDK
jgi:NAD(P)H-nitrite reductase large subunit